MEVWEGKMILGEGSTVERVGEGLGFALVNNGWSPEPAGNFVDARR